jgi:hypothetical protein
MTLDEVAATVRRLAALGRIRVDVAEEYIADLHDFGDDEAYEQITTDEGVLYDVKCYEEAMK